MKQRKKLRLAGEGLGGGAEAAGASFLLRCAELLHAADFVKQLDYKVLQGEKEGRRTKD